jgi:hypothetical protein
MPLFQNLNLKRRKKQGNKQNKFGLGGLLRVCSVLYRDTVNYRQPWFSEHRIHTGKYQLRPAGKKNISVASHGVWSTCISCVPRCLKDVYQLRPKVSEGLVSVPSQGVWRTCISCVPRCLKDVYQLRPKSEGHVSVASHGHVSCITIVY